MSSKKGCNYRASWGPANQEQAKHALTLVVILRLVCLENRTGEITRASVKYQKSFKPQKKFKDITHLLKIF